MNYSTYIPVEEAHFSQLSRAADYINNIEKRPVLKITIARIIADKDPLKPVMVEAKIEYKDLYTFFSVGHYFGIILEKTTPQTL